MQNKCIENALKLTAFWGFLIASVLEPMLLPEPLTLSGECTAVSVGVASCVNINQQSSVVQLTGTRAPYELVTVMVTVLLDSELADVMQVIDS